MTGAILLTLGVFAAGLVIACAFAACQLSDLVDDETEKWMQGQEQEENDRHLAGRFC